MPGGLPSPAPSVCTVQDGVRDMMSDAAPSVPSRRSGDAGAPPPLLSHT
eukprot:gene36291-26114_t